VRSQAEQPQNGSPQQLQLQLQLLEQLFSHLQQLQQHPLEAPQEQSQLLPGLASKQ